MHERAHVAARAARGAATILGAVPLLIFATGLAVAGPPGQDMENATEPTPAAFPPQSGGSVAVQSFLEDDAALLSWPLRRVSTRRSPSWPGTGFSPTRPSKAPSPTSPRARPTRRV